MHLAPCFVFLAVAAFCTGTALRLPVTTKDSKPLSSASSASSCALEGLVPPRMYRQTQSINGNNNNDTAHIWFFSPCAPGISARNPNEHYRCNPEKGFFQKWANFGGNFCEFSLDREVHPWAPTRNPDFPEVVGFKATFSGMAVGDQPVIANIAVYCDTSRGYVPESAARISHEGKTAVYDVQLGDPAVCNATGLPPVTGSPKTEEFCSQLTESGCLKCVTAGHNSCGFCRSTGTCTAGSLFGPFNSSCPKHDWAMYDHECDNNNNV